MVNICMVTCLLIRINDSVHLSGAGAWAWWYWWRKHLCWYSHRPSLKDIYLGEHIGLLCYLQDSAKEKRKVVLNVCSISFETFICSQTYFVWWYITTRQSSLDCSLHGQSHSEDANSHLFVPYLDNSVLNIEPFGTKLYMVMHCHGQGCHV